jgi:hypothetical protein
VAGLSSVTSTTFVGALTGAATTAGTVTTAAQPNITSVGTLSSVSVSGNVQGGNIRTAWLVSATGTVTGSSFSGAGTGLTGTAASLSVGSATTAGTVTTAAQPNITSVGTLSSVSVTGNVQGGNIRTAGLVSATGTVTGSSFSGAGTNLTGTAASLTVGTATVAGTVTTAAQPNITSVGTLSALAVTGNITGNNIAGNSAIINGDITGNTITASGNIELEARGILLLGDADSSNYIGLRAPAILTGNFTYVFPTGYGNASQVLTTNGAGTLSWENAGEGGGSGATQFPNSTVSPVPGSTGNFDLSKNFVQTIQETPFEAGGSDAFGVNLGEVYSMMDPVGEVLDPVDLGVIV